MTRTIIGLLLFSFLIISVVSFEDALASPAHVSHNDPTITFDVKEYSASGSINLTCVNNDTRPAKNIVWIVQKNNEPRIKGDQVSEDYQFPAEDYLNNGYKIKCRVNVAGSSFSGEWFTLYDFKILLIKMNYNIISFPDNFQGGINNGSTDSSTENNEGNGGCPDCNPPTAGVDNNGNRLVDFGAVLNGEAFQLDNFKTHIPMMFTEIGVENHLELKVYENHGAYNVDFMEFGIVKEIGSSMNIFEPRLEIDIKNTSNDIHNPALEGVELFDKEGIMSEYRVELSLVDCMEGFKHECLKLDIYWTFAKVPENKVLAFGGWDNTGSSFVQYLNDGLTVTDPNYVEPAPEELPAEKECRIYKVVKRIHTCQFQPMIDHEIQRAQETLEKMN